ncbi:hypothetical protein RDWZM_008975 [Blomia tropicalis]|uniref:Peroxisomal biogenesis factor 3 n=1 Tax=Blomia tropicalis TaxID=40697 RepID=A0A9Q0M0I1_BLOTA|nr:hypothetical protein RDWZM_008975 [Blomia tropicalis]
MAIYANNTNTIVASHLNQTSKERLTYFEKIKLEIFSFAVSEVYAIAFFITYMRVQLSITSGKMYNDSQKGNSTENSTQFNKDSNSSYSLFLHLLENFHQFGVENIVTHVRKVVEQCFNNIPVTEKVTLKGIVNLLEQVQNQMSSSLGSLIEENASIVFSTNKEHLTDEELNSNSRTFQEMRNCSKMIDEILDIVKISDFNKVIGNCTNIGFSNLYDFMSECFLKFEMDDDHQSSGEQAFMNDRQFINPNKIMIPLVKLLPEIWRQLNSYESRYDQINQRKFDFNDNKKNRNSLLVQYLLCSDSLTCFSANLYEAFCNEHEISNGQ